MVLHSNNLIGILIFLTLILSIPILVTGIWLHRQATTECEKWLEKPLIVIGAFLLFVSLAALLASLVLDSKSHGCSGLPCGHVPPHSYFFLYTIFAFAVTNSAGEVLSNRGYKEYRLGDYSSWLQKRVNGKNWERIKSCLQESEFCTAMVVKYKSDTAEKFYQESLSSLRVHLIF